MGYDEDCRLIINRSYELQDMYPELATLEDDVMSVASGSSLESKTSKGKGKTNASQVSGTPSSKQSKVKRHASVESSAAESGSDAGSVPGSRVSKRGDKSKRTETRVKSKKPKVASIITCKLKDIVNCREFSNELYRGTPMQRWRVSC